MQCHTAGCVSALRVELKGTSCIRMSRTSFAFVIGQAVMSQPSTLSMCYSPMYMTLTAELLKES